MKNVIVVVVAMFLSTGLARAGDAVKTARETKKITFKGAVEKPAFRAMETELETLCKAKKLESCDAVSAWGAFSVTERARDCMEAKHMGPPIDGTEWNPAKDEYEACYKSVRHEGIAYVEVIETCQVDCEHPPTIKPEPVKPPEAPKPTKQPDVKRPPKPDECDLRIVVYNASSTVGIALEFAKVLRSKGYKCVEYEKMRLFNDKPWDNCSVQSKKERDGAGGDIRELFKKFNPTCKLSGRKEPIPKLEKHDVVVIIGDSPQGKSPEVGDKKGPSSEDKDPGKKQPEEPPPEVEGETEDSLAVVRRNAKTINYALRVFTPGVACTIRPLWSLPDRLYLRAPIPNATCGVNLRLTFDTEYASVAFSAGPTFNVAYQSTVLSGQTVPGGIGAHAGMELYFAPLMHLQKPFTRSQIKSAHDSWFGNRVLIGGYVDVEGMSTLLRPAGFAGPQQRVGLYPVPPKVWEQQYALLNFGPALRLDLFPYGTGGVIFRAGPTIGLKHERIDGYWQRNQTMFVPMGFSVSMELFGRLPFMSDWLSTLGTETRPEKEDSK